MSTTDALRNKWSWLVPARSWNRLHYVEGVTFETWDDWCCHLAVAVVPGFKPTEALVVVGQAVSAMLGKAS